MCAVYRTIAATYEASSGCRTGVSANLVKTALTLGEMCAIYSPAIANNTPKRAIVAR
jgi:hypothetical protein